VIPAVVHSNTCSKVPANRLTSVDVPPISKPMIALFPGVVLAYPTTPPAGPERTALDPLNLRSY
jgi:hypothetical protein